MFNLASDYYYNQFNLLCNVFKEKQRQEAIDKGLIILPIPKKEQRKTMEGIEI